MPVPTRLVGGSGAGPWVGVSALIVVWLGVCLVAIDADAPPAPERGVQAAPAQAQTPPQQPVRGSNPQQPIRASVPGGAAPASSAAPHQAVFDRYCISCHSQSMKSRGIVPVALDTLRVDNVSADPAAWEKVVLKLRAGV